MSLFCFEKELPRHPLLQTSFLERNGRIKKQEKEEKKGGKSKIPYHVLRVGHESLERDLGLPVAVDGRLALLDGLVAVFRLHEPEGPVGGQPGAACFVLFLLVGLRERFCERE